MRLAHIGHFGIRYAISRCLGFEKLVLLSRLSNEIAGLETVAYAVPDPKDSASIHIGRAHSIRIISIILRIT